MKSLAFLQMEDIAACKCTATPGVASGPLFGALRPRVGDLQGHFLAAHREPCLIKCIRWMSSREPWHHAPQGLEMPDGGACPATLGLVRALFRRYVSRVYTSRSGFSLICYSFWPARATSPIPLVRSQTRRTIPLLTNLHLFTVPATSPTTFPASSSTSTKFAHAI